MLLTAPDQKVGAIFMPQNGAERKRKEMKVYRYMSEKEFSLYWAGCDVEGKRDHQARTDSTGVCFLPETITFDSHGETTFGPIDAYSFLRGIVSSELLVEFETETEMTESWGCYADPFNPWESCIDISELCTPSYSRDTMTALRYHIPGDNGNDGPVWYNTGLV